jgi:hypothetical protein
VLVKLRGNNGKKKTATNIKEAVVGVVVATRWIEKKLVSSQKPEASSTATDIVVFRKNLSKYSSSSRLADSAVLWYPSPLDDIRAGRSTTL